MVILNILSFFYFRARKRNKNPSRKIESTSCKKQEYFKRTSRAEAVASNNAKTSSSPEGGAVSDWENHLWSLGRSCSVLPAVETGIIRVYNYYEIALLTVDVLATVRSLFVVLF